MSGQFMYVWWRNLTEIGRNIFQPHVSDKKHNDMNKQTNDKLVDTFPSSMIALFINWMKIVIGVVQK